MYIEIENEAEKLLKNNQLYSCPVDVDALVEYLKIKVIKSDPNNRDLSGALIRSDNITSMLINTSHSLLRQRFTMAHELGHYILHADNAQFVDRDLVMFRASGGDYLKEREANAFAAALLMPKDLVKEEYQKLGANEDLIKALACLFDVSLDAMKYRLISLGYITAY